MWKRLQLRKRRVLRKWDDGGKRKVPNNEINKESRYCIAYADNVIIILDM